MSNRTPLIHHVALPVQDYEKGKQFYTELMAFLGRGIVFEVPGEYIDYADGAFAVSKSESEHPTCVHLAFGATSNEQVDAFYNKAISLGATCNGKPGIRKEYSPSYYAAFFHDFEGNNIEIVHIGNPEDYDYNAKK